MNENKYIVNISKDTADTIVCELNGEFNQSIAKDLHRDLLNYSLFKEKIIFDFKNVIEIDLSCVQLIASVILERNSNNLQSEISLNEDAMIKDFLAKTGLIKFFNSITNTTT